MNYNMKKLRNMEYELIEKEMLELSIRQEQEYYEYIRRNERKSKILDSIINEVNKCNNKEAIQNIKEILSNEEGVSSF